MTDTPVLRADARRNREKLLAAATELFSESAAGDVPLDAVARRAGVGIGTLYRHFPSREALLEEAYRSEVLALHDSAGELLAELPADEAITEWLRRFVGYASAKRGLTAAMQAMTGEMRTESRAHMVAAVTALLQAGASDGTLRTDIDGLDVLPAMQGIWLATEDPDGARAERLIGLLVDGLRARR